MNDFADQRPRVVVIGGGLSGLTAAYRLTTAKTPSPIQVTLLEARNRLGGAIGTDRANGFLLEAGPDSFLTTKPGAVELCHELGLSGQIIGTSPRNRRSFVVRHGRLMSVPEGFVLMSPGRLGPLLASPVLSWRGKLRLLLDLVLPRNDGETEESLAGFARRRLGREVFERLVQPLAAALYNANPDELSLPAILPHYLELERQHRSLILAARRQRAAAGPDPALDDSSGARYGLSATLADGMGGLVDALASCLPTGTIRTGTPIRRVCRNEPLGPWRIEPLDAPPIEADAVIVATEAHAAARLLDPLDPELALTLRAFPYASTSIVQLAYKRDQIAHPLDGFGAVVPQIDNRSLLALSFSSVKFAGRAPDGHVLLRAFLGGALQPELCDLDDDATLALACRETAELLGVQGDPLLGQVARHHRAMPRYTLGHLERVARVQRLAQHHADLLLAGNYLGGVGISDCIRQGSLAAEQILARLARLAAVAA